MCNQKKKKDFIKDVRVFTLALLFMIFSAGFFNKAVASNVTAKINSFFPVTQDGKITFLFTTGSKLYFTAEIDIETDSPVKILGLTKATGVNQFTGRTLMKTRVETITESGTYTLTSKRGAKIKSSSSSGVAEITLTLIIRGGGGQKHTKTTHISINSTKDAGLITMNELEDELASKDYYTPDGWIYETPPPYLTYNDISDPPEKFLIEVMEWGNFEDGHIQDSFHISRAAFFEDESLLYKLVPDITTPIITYCDGFGQEQQFAEKASELGYQDVRYYGGGRTEWKNYNYLVIETESLKKLVDQSADVYIVDTWIHKNDADDARGMIPGATALDLDLYYSSGQLVDNGSALLTACPDLNKQIIFYCGDWVCGRSQSGCLAGLELGYKNVYRYQGGIVEWVDVFGYSTVPTPPKE
ncbi:MAG: rhodanese-like domain-containing protein [Thermodesulfobacteriota bacterium]|nr:rhodanese-like domain-containing protein [Thermodesulfobacteriota bacterium]